MLLAEATREEAARAEAEEAARLAAVGVEEARQRAEEKRLDKMLPSKQWKRVASQSRPGEFSYLHLPTGQKQATIPTRDPTEAEMKRHWRSLRTAAHHADGFEEMSFEDKIQSFDIDQDGFINASEFKFYAQACPFCVMAAFHRYYPRRDVLRDPPGYRGLASGRRSPRTRTCTGRTASRPSARCSGTGATTR